MRARIFGPEILGQGGSFTSKQDIDFLVKEIGDFIDVSKLKTASEEQENNEEEKLPMFGASSSDY